MPSSAKEEPLAGDLKSPFGLSPNSTRQIRKTIVDHRASAMRLRWSLRGALLLALTHASTASFLCEPGTVASYALSSSVLGGVRPVDLAGDVVVVDVGWMPASALLWWITSTSSRCEMI